MRKKVFITGISGFAGSHLAEYLLKHGDFKISGTYLTKDSLQNIASIKDKIHLEQVDLMAAKDVDAIIGALLPDTVFHLAALASPAKSFEKPSETITNNIIAQVHVLEAIRKNNLKHTRVLIVSSADIYGRVDAKNLPIDEVTPFMPLDPYAVSKIAQDYLGLQYFLTFRFPIVRARPFNHIGVRQSSNFVISSFAKKIAEIEKGLTKPILRVGNLESKRDFTNVRDIVRAYCFLVDHGKAGEAYNIGTGKSYAIKEILDKLVALSNTKIKVMSDPSLFRPKDTPELVCNNQKIQDATGWKPVIPLEDSLKEVLDYWRGIL